MTDNQLNYLNMTNATTTVMDNNNTLWSANIKISAAVLNVKTTVTGINAAAGIQGQDKSGTTANKHALWAVAALKAEHVCAGAHAYYDDLNDLPNMALVSYTNTDFEKGSALEAVVKMQLVHDKAASIAIASLTPYNVIAADITVLQTAITNFSNAIPGHTILQASTSAATEQLSGMFVILRAQMKKLDNLMKTMKIAQPTFVSTFEKARQIIALGKTQQAEELNLHPLHFEAVFGKKFKKGDTLTIRNHSEVEVEAALTDTPSEMPTTGKVQIAAQSELKLSVPTDFGGVFGHWLMIHNESNIEDAKVTIVLAHGKSASAAPSPGNVAP